MTALAGKLAVVTGASRGIGLAIACQLEAAGAHVVRLARTLDEEQAPRHTDLACDVTSESEVQRVGARVLAERGVPDILVNNAGAFLLKPLVETTADEFQEQVAANLLGAFLLLRAFLPHLIQRRSGHIVNIGSVADHRPYAGNVAYGASKYGLRGLHEALGQELAGTGVRLTLISPGPTDTTAGESVQQASGGDGSDRATVLQPADVAEAVLFAVTRPPHVNVDWLWVEPNWR